MMEKSKNWFWILLNAVLAVAVVVGLASLMALYRYQKSLYPSRTINVSASAKATVAPDVATFTFSVVTEGADPEDVAERNNEIMNRAIAFVKSEGVADEDVRTTGYDLSPRYRFDESGRREQEIVGYTLTQTVRVKVREFEKIGTLLGRLPEMGINRVGALSFTIDDPDAFLGDAREEAFEKAREKAKEMARENKVRIKRVVTFSEYSNGFPGPFYYEESFGRGGDLAVPQAIPAPTIEPGSQEVNVTVNVTYEISS